MKKNSTLMFVSLTILAFSFQVISAQITINLPKLPKIKKDKQEQPKKESQPTVTNNDGQSNDSQPINNQSNNSETTESKPSAPADQCANSIWLRAHVEDINKRREEIDSFTPDRGWFAGRSTNDHVLFAVSPAAKEKWLKDSEALDFKDCPTLVAAFDKLAASAAKKLPQYLPNTKVYPMHNPLEEKLMKAKISNLADHKIFYIGIQEPSWLIDKNEFGIPKSRYKHGMVWVRYTPNDHPYCRIYYINIIQDYAGGGTYGASYGYFVKDQLSGCPAGK